MAKKMRRFEEGGDVDPLEEANQRFEAEEAAKPKAEAKPEAPAPKPKAKVVTKEELEKSGMSLRDYMNKQQGLTRREPKKDPTAGEADDTPAQRLADRLNANTGKFASSEKKNPRINMQGVNPKTLLGQKTSNFAKGGSVTRGDGCAQRGKTRGMMR
jgi:hypothetical protein